MAVHYFVQSYDLKKISDRWITMKEFEPYLEHFLAVCNEYTKEDFARLYFERVIEIHTKHFKQWQTKYLHLCLAGNGIPAKLFANWILKRDTSQDIPQNYNSEKHITKIATSSLLEFLTRGHNVDDNRQQEYLILHEPAIIEIVKSNGLWSDEVSEAMTKLQAYMKKEWLIVPSNTQRVETWVKNTNECTETGKDQYI